MRGQALIWDRHIPILGINTYPSAFTGALNTAVIDYHNRFKMTAALLEAMEDEHAVEFERRSRIMFERVQQNEEMEPRKILCLNEVFAAEKDVASASRYCIVKDDNDLGVFKSSGLIVSTGTGSTAWLYAARQITPHKLKDIQMIIGNLESSELVND